VRLLLGYDEQVAVWAAARIPHMGVPPEKCVGMGIVDGSGHLRGAALFHGYTPAYRSIDISFVLESPRWLTLPVTAGIMAYPFIQLHCGRVTAATPRKSASARRFLEKFGFKREGLVRRGFGDFGDAVVYGLTERDWSESRFHPGRALDGQVHAHAASGA
jgi:hypothetical protein